MKKHLTIPVTAKHVVSPTQFPDDHETPTADIFPAGSVAPWEETHYRKTSREVAVDRVVRVPHDRLKAGQMVVDTHRVQDMIDHPPPRGDLKARQLPDGTYMLRDGHHRVAADIVSGRRKTADVHVDVRWEAP